MASPFTIELKKAQQFFFDRKLVNNAVDKATARTLGRMGAFIRTTARRSLRRSKKISKPGDPPRIHTAGKQNLKFILFNYQPNTRSVIIGPVRFSTQMNVAKLQEFGGSKRIHRKRRGTGRTIARYPKRPFMQPALEAEADKAPSVFADMLAKSRAARQRR